MRGNVPVRFGKGPMEKDQQWYLASGLLHGHTLSQWTLGELGSRLEFSIHNAMHMRWSTQPTMIRPDVDPTQADATITLSSTTFRYFTHQPCSKPIPIDDLNVKSRFSMIESRSVV